MNPTLYARGLAEHWRGPAVTAVSIGAMLFLGLYVSQGIDLSIYDVLPDAVSPFFRPELTLTRSSIQDSWAPLADFLADAIAGKPVETQQRVAGFDFVEGQSVAAIPG